MLNARPHRVASSVGGRPARGAGRSGRLALTAAAWAALAGTASAGAAQDLYTGKSSTSFSDGGNWSLGVEPGASNDGVFDQTSYTYPAPTLTGPDGVLGLIFGDSSGTAAAPVTINGSSGLTVGTDGIVAYAGAGAATINAPLTLASGGSFITSNSTAGVTVANVSTGSNVLTIGGSGNVFFTGATGTTDGSGYVAAAGVVVNSTGTVHFNVSASPVTGPVTVNSGTLSMDYGNFNSGPFTTNGTFVVNAGGTLVINAAHSLANYYGAYLTVNGGTVTANYEQYIASLTMTGGTVQNGTTNGELRTDYFGTAPITTLASSSTATISTNLATENSQNFDFNTASGSTASGVDLNVTGAITNAGGFIKDGPGTLQLTNNFNTFTGNVTVNAGTVITSGRGYYLDSGGLGAVDVAGRTVTINAGATVSFTTNNVFGNGTTDGTTINTDVPTVTLNGGTLTANNYNVLGNVVLNTGATLTHSAAAGGYSGYQFLGSVTAGGTSGSTVSATNGGSDNLGTNTDFIVAATGDPNADLTVSLPLTDQSPDFGGAPGGLTKDGAGTMVLAGANTFTGNVTVNAGNLIAGGGQGDINDGGLGASTVAGRTVTVNAGGTLTFAVNNTFGGGTLEDGTGTLNPNIPTLVINGGTVTTAHVDQAAASSYTPLGNVTLDGGTLTSKADTVDPSSTNPDPTTGFPGYPADDDDVYYAAYQLLGTVTVTGSAPSTISAPTSAIHLGANTVFNVAVTGSAGPDLVVSAPLIDQSGDFEDANGNVLPGGLTKAGAGTMALTGTSGYFGPTNVSAGTLLVNGALAPATFNGSSPGSSPVTVFAGAVLGGTGSISGTVLVAGTITGGSGAAAGNTAGTLTTGPQTWNGSGGSYVAKVTSISPTSTAANVNDRLIMSALTQTRSGFNITLLPTTGSTPTFTASDPKLTSTPVTGSYLVLATDTESGATNPFASAATLAALGLTLTNDGVKPASSKDLIELATESDGSGFDLIAEDVAATPEPTSLLLAAAAAAPLALGRRRRTAPRVCRV